MNRKAQKKCRKILDRQARGDAYFTLPWRVRCGLTDMEHLNDPRNILIEPRYLVDDKEVSQEEFNKTLVSCKVCQQMIDWLSIGFEGTASLGDKKVKLQIIHPTLDWKYSL